MDTKLVYLVKTLSKTNRKDYENYVVNAIWNRIDDPRLVPVSQQFIKDKDGNHYFIDLYFPQLKIGIECDEGYHKSKEQKILDAEREVTIFDVLKQVDERDYIALHVDVTKSYDDVQNQINSHVATIKNKIEEFGIDDGWTKRGIVYGTGYKRQSYDSVGSGEQQSSAYDEYIHQSAEIEEYFKDKEYITIYDDVIFPSNRYVYNIILGQNYSYHLMHGGEPFRKLYTEYGYEEGTFPWFPKLTINKPTKKGYYNQLSKDGTEIYEYIDDHEKNMQRKAEGRYIGKKRVVFSQVKDSLTGISGYRFVGFFIGDHYDENGIITYKRIDDKFKIIKK